ncbi:MAG: DUF262 domain-containing protein [Candidatus Micrarchaeota archaeon]
MLKRKVIEWTVKEIIEKYRSAEIDLDAEYQREYIWTLTEKRRLIDSILNDIDIPKLYFAEFPDEKKRYECIDGKQRINSILDFFNGEITDLDGRHYQDLANKKQFDDYVFTISIIPNPTEEYVSELFKRLNLGVPLNGAEMLKAQLGEMRDFIFKEFGRDGPFISKTGLGMHRFSRELALAQIIMNAAYFRGGAKEKFKRTRWEDLSAFLDEHKKLSSDDRAALQKIRSNMELMEKIFSDRTKAIRGRAATVSAYLFFEELVSRKEMDRLKHFVEFFILLMDELTAQVELIKHFKEPTNRVVLEKFQKYLQQASVESYSLTNRHQFLDEAFSYYIEKKTILGRRGKVT